MWAPPPPPVPLSEARGLLPNDSSESCLPNTAFRATGDRSAMAWLSWISESIFEVITQQVSGPAGLLGRFLGPLRQRGQKSIRRGRRIHLARQCRFERHHMSVKLSRSVLVLLYDRAVQTHAGKNTAGAGIGENLGPHLPVGIAFGMSSHGARRHRGIRTQRELARQQMLHAIVVHEDR